MIVHVNNNFDVNIDAEVKIVWCFGVVVHFDSIVSESVEASILGVPKKVTP